MKIAIIDSGIHAGHPHVGPVAGAVHFAGADAIDRLGHGTAVAGAIREKAPDADLFAVKVFDQRLSITIATLLQALDWCRENSMDIVNLSLGTTNPEHRAALQTAVRGNGIVVSAAGMMPGILPGVVAVAAEDACPRDRFRYREGVFRASPFPRPIPEVPPERNLSGVSFAVANMTGFVARAFDGGEDLFATLRGQAESI
jgi:hypothetical protein